MKDRAQYLEALARLENNNNSHGVQILTGQSNPELAKRVSSFLMQSLDEPISGFPDGERRTVIKAPLRRREVFIIQPTAPPRINDSLMELYGMLDASRRESPDEITAVIPYFAYARQDRREQAGAPIMADLIAEQIVAAGAKRIVTVDLHSEQTMGAVRSSLG